MLLLLPCNAQLLPWKFAPKNHVMHTLAPCTRHPTHATVFHTAGTVALADVYTAVSNERVQQQVRAVFQSILPSSVDDCDADTLYLTLRLHPKKVMQQHIDNIS